MILSKKDLKEFLNVELSYYGVGLKIYLPINIGENQILAKHIKLLRYTEYFYNTKKNICAYISRIRLLRLQNKYGIHIPINTFDCGLHIMHLGPILVNSKACIGKNCAIHINTAIVAGGIDSQCPNLGDNITIGIGATLLGGITIEDGVAIGANALVNKSIDKKNVTIAGNPAKIISANSSFDWNKSKV